MSDDVGTSSPGDAPVIDHDGQHDAGALGLVAWITDVGHGRKRNEDRLLVKDAFDGRFLLLVVADGAGGHERGDKAATAVVETLNQVFSTTGNCPDGPPLDWLDRVIMEAHSRVEGLAEGGNRPPASTLVGLLVERETLCGWRFHVGDSRLYGRREVEPARSWTRDHNITNGLIDRGLPAAQAVKIAEGGKLTQVMGGANTPEPEIRGPFQLCAGDSFLLCSDGIYGYNAKRDPISPALDPALGDARERADALKAAVLAGDALDNLTAVIWSLPLDAEPSRQRLGLVQPFDRQDLSTLVGMPAHQTEEQGNGRTGPPPPQSMPGMVSVTDSDLRKRTGPTPEERAAAQARLDAAAAPSGLGPGLKLGMMLMAAIAILALLVWNQSNQDINEPMSAAELEAERASARAMAGLPPETREPATLAQAPAPAPTALGVLPDPVEMAIGTLVGGFDPDWWQGLSQPQRDERLAALRELLGPRAAAPMTLSWEEGEPPVGRESAQESWPAPGGANAELAATAWAARGRILGLHGGLANQPGMDEALRRAACDQLRLRWPGAGGEDAVQLPSWIGGCLPADADGASVMVRLGDYPARGWSDEDWTELATLADSPGGAASVVRFDASTWNPRLVELGQLALALSRAPLEGLEAEVRVVLDAEDPPGLAGRRAEQIARLLAEGSGGLRVAAVGAEDEPLVSASEDLTAIQKPALQALNRRVELTLFRATPLELEDDEASPPPPAPEEGEGAK